MNNISKVIIFYSDIGVKFAHTQYTGSEAKGFVVITLELVNGTSSDPFNITVTPLEQPSASAKGNKTISAVISNKSYKTEFLDKPDTKRFHVWLIGQINNLTLLKSHSFSEFEI